MQHVEIWGQLVSSPRASQILLCHAPFWWTSRHIFCRASRRGKALRQMQRTHVLFLQAFARWLLPSKRAAATWPLLSTPWRLQLLYKKGLLHQDNLPLPGLPQRQLRRRNSQVMRRPTTPVASRFTKSWPRIEKSPEPPPGMLWRQTKTPVTRSYWGALMPWLSGEDKWQESSKYVYIFTYVWRFSWFSSVCYSFSFSYS